MRPARGPLSRLSGPSSGDLTAPLGLAAGLGLAALAAALCVSVVDVQVYPGEDLRPRVLGARALLAGLDPYTYEATAETPETLQDYTRQFARLSRTTYPPTLLLLYAPFAPCSYRAQRIGWAIAEWAALLASIALLARGLRQPGQRATFLGVAGVLFGGGYFWRLHVERGQYYVFLLLLCAGAFACLRGPRRRELLAGGLLGTAVALRPSLAPAIPLLWLFSLRKTALGAAATATLFVALTLPLAGLHGWTSWVASVGLLERTIYGDAALIRALGVPLRPPAVLEGHDYARAAYLAGYSADASVTFLVQRVARLAGLARPGAGFEATWSWLSKLLAFASLAAYAGAALRLGVPGRRVGTRLAAALLGAMLVDAFVILRVSYADLLLLAPLALLWPALLSTRAPRWPVALVVGGLLLGAQLLLVPTRLGWLGAFVRPFAVLAGLIGCSLWSSGPPGPRRPPPAPMG